MQSNITCDGWHWPAASHENYSRYSKKTAKTKNHKYEKNQENSDKIHCDKLSTRKKHLDIKPN